jgi:DNA-binding MarR family transcriptional regulator
MPLRFVPPIHRATHRIGLYLADLRDDNLSQGEAHILALLATAAPATIAELHRGLVTRTVGQTDRRTFVITPTAKGREVATRVKRHLTSLEHAVARRVSAEEVAAFLKVVSLVEQEAHARTSKMVTAFATRAGRGRRKPAPARDR